MPRCIRGDKLTPAQRLEVLAAFVHRDTVERPWIEKDRIRHGRTVERVTDEEWLKTHAFYITQDGHLATKPAYCEPASYDDDDLLAELKKNT